MIKGLNRCDCKRKVKNRRARVQQLMRQSQQTMQGFFATLGEIFLESERVVETGSQNQFDFSNPTVMRLSLNPPNPMVIQHPNSSPKSERASENSADKIVCHCHDVRESTVRDAIVQNLAESVAEVTLSTCAGGSCQACHCKIKRMLKGEPPVPESTTAFCQQCNSLTAICVCTAA